MKNVTVGNCKKMIIDMDRNIDQNDDSFKAAVVMLYGSLSGKHHAGTLRSKTGYASDFVKSVCSNLRKNLIWQNGMTHADWGNETEGSSEFWLHVAVALGFIERA